MKKKRRMKKFAKILILIVLISVGYFLYNNIPITENKVINDLYKLSLYDKRILKIIDNKDDYPEEMIEMLSRNMDMTDYVLGFNEKKGNIYSENIGNVIKGEFPLLLQYDERWGYGIYGDNVIAINGCGPTVISMVIAGLTGKSDVTPYNIAQYSENNGYYKDLIGTRWDLMTEGVKKFGISGTMIILSKSKMIDELERGHPIVCSMRKGDFTTKGHFILIVGVKNGKFVINDPNSKERSRKLWDYETLEHQIKNLWSFKLVN